MTNDGNGYDGIDHARFGDSDPTHGTGDGNSGGEDPIGDGQGRPEESLHPAFNTTQRPKTVKLTHGRRIHFIGASFSADERVDMARNMAESPVNARSSSSSLASGGKRP